MDWQRLDICRGDNAGRRLVTASEREHPDLFLDGDYVPLAVEVTVPGGLVGFARLTVRACAVVVAPRLVSRLVSPERPLPLGAEAWKDSRVRVPDAIEIPRPPFTRAVGLPRDGAHWVRPEVVVQVAFIEWTGNGKLRHPRLLGVRTDKIAREVVREA